MAEKKTSGKFEEAFIKKRMAFLQNFINYIIEHPAQLLGHTRKVLSQVFYLIKKYNWAILMMFDVNRSLETILIQIY